MLPPWLYIRISKPSRCANKAITSADTYAALDAEFLPTDYHSNLTTIMRERKQGINQNFSQNQGPCRYECPNEYMFSILEDMNTTTLTTPFPEETGSQGWSSLSSSDREPADMDDFKGKDQLWTFKVLGTQKQETSGEYLPSSQIFSGASSYANYYGCLSSWPLCRVWKATFSTITPTYLTPTCKGPAAKEDALPHLR